MVCLVTSVCTRAVTWVFFNMVHSAVAYLFSFSCCICVFFASHLSAQAGARTDGTSRDQRTRIINAYLKREGGELVPQPHHPLFEQILVDQKKKDTTAGCVRWSVIMGVLG